MKNFLLFTCALIFSANVSAQIIFSEDFEGATVPALPAGWTQTSLATDGGYLTTDDWSSTYWAIPPHTRYIGTNDDDCDCDKSDDRLISPLIALGPMFNYALTFDNLVNGGYGEMAFLGVHVDGTPAGTVDTLLTLPGTAQTWDSQVIDLSAYSGQSINLVWMYNDASTWAFGLMIDDVVVVESGNPDLAASNTRAGIYTVIPLPQVTTVTPSVDITNVGGGSATNPTAAFSIISPISFSGTETFASLAGFTTNTFTSTTGFTPSALGSYQLIVSASMDELDDDLSNNNDTASFIVSTNMYARDNGTFDNGIGVIGENAFLGQDFEIFSNTTLSEVQFYLNTAIIGDEISVEVFDQVGGIPTSSIASSDTYTITAADAGGAWITLPVTQGNLALSEGTYTIGVNQLSTNNYGLALDTQLPFSGVWGSIAGGAFATLESFGFPGTFLIRAILCDASTPSITGFSNTGAQGTTVSWDPQSLPESGGFVIRYHEFGNSPNFSWQLVPNENQTSAYVGGLNDNTRYVFRVGSKCSMSQNATYSDTSSVWTRNQCARPIGLQSSSMGPESQVLDWQQPDADSYKVRFRPVGGSWGYRNINTGANTVTLSGLTPSTNYEWHVRSICNDGGNRPYAPLQSFTTPSLRLAASATTIGIYPNPTNGELTVEYHVEESTQASLQILEVNGRVVSNASVTAQEGQNRERLDLSDLAPGFYLLRLVDVNGAVLMNERISKN